MIGLKLIAILLIVVLQILCSLGNYWFTFHLWPVSWGSFILFMILQLILMSFTTFVSNYKAKE